MNEALESRAEMRDDAERPTLTGSMVGVLIVEDEPLVLMDTVSVFPPPA